MTITFACEIVVPEGVIRLVVSASVPTLFIRYSVNKITYNS